MGLLIIYCTEAQVKAMIRDSNADGNDNPDRVLRHG
jgi:hypothetical protein